MVAVKIQSADCGDTTTLDRALEAAAANLETVVEKLNTQHVEEGTRPGRQPTRKRLQHVIAENGYHSAAVCERLKGQRILQVISKPKGRRRPRWLYIQPQQFLQCRRQGLGTASRHSWWNGPLPTNAPSMAQEAREHRLSPRDSHAEAGRGEHARA